MTRRPIAILGVCAAALGAATLVAGIYLRPFVDHPTWPPFGSDPYGYAWRASVVAQHGIRWVPRLPDRPAHPLLVDLLAIVAGTSPLAVMRTLPAILAAAVALAAVAASTGALGFGIVEAALLGIAVGGSAFVAWTAVGYSANLAIDPLLLSAVALGVPAAVRGHRTGLVGACLMLAAAFLYHWPLAALFVAIWLTASLLLRSLARARLIGRALGLARATGRRLAVTATIGGLLGVVLLLITMPRLPSVLPGAAVGRIRPLLVYTAIRMPALAFPLTSTLAILAAIALARHRQEVRRTTVLVLAAWAGAGALGASAWYLLRVPTPPYRWAIFALPVPLLTAAAPAGLVRARAENRLRRIVIVCLSACITAWLVARGTGVWWEQHPRHPPALYQELEAVTSYAHSLRSPTYLVLLMPRRNPVPVLAGLAPDLADRVLFHPPPGPSRSPLGTAVLALDALMPRPLTPRWDVLLRHGRPLAPGVRLIRGPAPVDVPAVRRPFPTARATVIGAAAGLAVLWIAGIGWAAALGAATLETVWVAPALGIASLGIIGSIAARLGVVPRGLAAIVIVIATTVAGILGAVAQHAARRSRKLPRSDD